MEFKEQLSAYIDMTNAELERLVPSCENLQKSIYEAMRYSLFAGGKRIRPVIAMGVCSMLGGKAEKALDFACALECIHTYSLIHDDLPCMDNDDLRRGKPTCHKVFGEANALLAGDALLNKAFEIMAFSDMPSDIIVEVIKNISLRSGTEGMIGGQVVDLESEGNTEVSECVLQYIHENKTGALIDAAAQIGAICGGADSEERESIASFAKNLGLAFQIKDDILDYIGDEEVLGKPIGSDKENQKSTFVTLLGIENAQTELVRTTKAAKAALERFGAKNSFLISLADFLLERNY